MDSLFKSSLIGVGCLLLISVCQATESEEDYKKVPEPAEPPKPYRYAFVAGRFPGDIDRTHAEYSDGTGVVRGQYSYIDPSKRIRTVEYVADQNGFHPSLSIPNEDTPVVAQAKQYHAELYDKIAARNLEPSRAIPKDTRTVARAKSRHADLYERIAAEHARIAAERRAQNPHYEEDNNGHYDANRANYVGSESD
ncbi:hypothetical protein M8J76_013903 [Diaphorina citri]|nr:hypothetical protein M8J75_005787 [Diaphorina citri]KAI5714267.1 hypothetical protein M8J76_013903 [Diaphorina citri]KAI5715010.1 hypothetical protein M8J77_008940 [Diaphorina citri]